MSYDVVKDYGAYRDGTHPTETTNAFLNAIHDAKSAPGGGDVVTGPSGYYAIDRPLDFRNQTGSYGLMLNGKYSSWLCSTVQGQATIYWGGSGTKNARFGGFGIRQGDGSMPTVHNELQIAMHAPGGVGYGGILEDLWIDGFPSHSIVISGETGPTVIRDYTIQCCDGWGVVLTYGPQNVTLQRGSIQMMRGGVIGVEVTALAIRDCDMELGNWNTHAGIDLDGGSASCTISGGNVSLSAMPDVGAAIRIAGFGNTIENMMNFASGGEVHNLLFDGPSCQNNKVRGGYYRNNGSAVSGYFAKVLGGTDNRFEPGFIAGRQVPTPSYQPGRDAVWDVSYPDNRSQALGVHIVGNPSVNTLSPITIY